LWYRNFRHATKGDKRKRYSPSALYVIEKINFPLSSSFSETLKRLLREIAKVPEIYIEDVQKKQEGRKVVNAIIHTTGSDEFVDKQFEGFELRNRVDTAYIEPSSGTLLLEPVRSHYKTSKEYQQAVEEYKVAKGKGLYNRNLIPYHENK